MPASASADTIYNSLAATAAQEEALADLYPAADTAAQLQADLSSGSTVSPNRLFMRLFAYASKLLQDLWDNWKAEVLGLAKDGHYGTARWFAAKALAWQSGDVLVLSLLDAGYATDNPAARIITHAAVVEAGNRVIIKVAKAAGTGLQQLTTEELLGVNDYFQELRPPVLVTVLTATADLLKLGGSIIFDPEIALSTTQAAVNLAVTQFLGKLAFGGVFRITDLRNAILAVPGVVDVYFTSVQARSLGVYQTVGRTYYSYAGYMSLDATYPLTTALAWQAGDQ